VADIVLAALSNEPKAGKPKIVNSFIQAVHLEAYGGTIKIARFSPSRSSGD